MCVSALLCCIWKIHAVIIRLAMVRITALRLLEHNCTVAHVLIFSSNSFILNYPDKVHLKVRFMVDMSVIHAANSARIMN